MILAGRHYFIGNTVVGSDSISLSEITVVVSAKVLKDRFDKAGGIPRLVFKSTGVLH